MLIIIPCIDAGTDIGYEYFGDAPDIGCFEYYQYTSIAKNPSTELTIFPNPASNYLNIKSPYIIQQVVISDVTGRQIVKYKKANKHTVIELSGLNEGIYIIQVRTDNGVFSETLKKENHNTHE